MTCRSVDKRNGVSFELAVVCVGGWSFACVRLDQLRNDASFATLLDDLSFASTGAELYLIKMKPF